MVVVVVEGVVDDVVEGVVEDVVLAVVEAVVLAVLSVLLVLLVVLVVLVGLPAVLHVPVKVGRLLLPTLGTHIPSGFITPISPLTSSQSSPGLGVGVEDVVEELLLDELVLLELGS